MDRIFLFVVVGFVIIIIGLGLVFVVVDMVLGKNINGVIL